MGRRGEREKERKRENEKGETREFRRKLARYGKVRVAIIRAPQTLCRKEYQLSFEEIVFVVTSFEHQKAEQNREDRGEQRGEEEVQVHLDAKVGVQSETEEEQRSDENGEDADALQDELEDETGATVCGFRRTGR